MKKEKQTYNLTFWQKVFMPLSWFLWVTYAGDDRKTWHETKKGAEIHEHNYTIPQTIKGIRVLRCEHEGCYMVDPQD